MTQNYESLVAAVDAIRPDVEKAEKGNKAATSRVRKSMQDLKNLAQDIRKEMLELRDAGVAVISIWPGLVLTERTRGLVDGGQFDFEGAESQRFTGRAIAHLAADSEVLSDSGTALTSRGLADRYGFRDLDGGLPKGPLHQRPDGLT